MGFAGQVFAARVAVGLAMPSPAAFSQAGAAIGKFSSDIYNNLNRQNVQAASTASQNASKELNTQQQRMKKHMSSQNDFMKKNATDAANAVSKGYEKWGKKVSIGAGAMKTLKASIPKPISGKLFQNVSTDIKDGKEYAKLMKNFALLAKREQDAVLLSLEAQKQDLKNKIATKAQRDAMDDADLKKIQLKIEKNKTLSEHFGKTQKDMVNAKARFGEDTKKIQKKLDNAQDKANLKLKESNRLKKLAEERTKRWTVAMGRATAEIKRGFNDALRESISVLTAFYYKLNQNVGELTAFERELMNANSVFRITNNELFNVGNTIVEFGQKFGMEMQNGATGLYQLASAGLTANEAMELLPNTLKLSMAVQGDHNTISKLTAQTLFGFGMEMNQAALVTDKFAHAIQKSLIEYEDLSSAVKFALPFFTTTGQSIDQLLGALAVLTNRALEAGIAGRGLRQGLAELAESVGDNTAAFRKFGVEVTDSQGNMLQLTEIAANFASVLEAGVINDTELLTTLIEDLNVRGATAFVHLVQASDEFTAAVKSSEEAGGELDEMVKIQNASMAAQVQILKNNVSAIFMLRDANYEGTEFMNAFHEAVVTGIQSVKDLIVVETENGMVLTAMGQQIQDIAVQGMQMLVQVVQDIIPLIKEFTESGALNVELLKVYLIPLQMVVKAIELVGPNVVKWVIAMHILNKALAGNVIVMGVAWAAQQLWNSSMMWSLTLQSSINVQTGAATAGGIAYTASLGAMTFATWAWSSSLAAVNVALVTFHTLTGGVFLAIAALIASVIFMVVKIKQSRDAWNESNGAVNDFSDTVWNFLDTSGRQLLTFMGQLLGMARAVANAFSSISGAMGATKNFVGKLNPFANGGMVGPIYAAEGASVGAPSAYLVGERGPEIFMPRQAGKIIPNKDLNTQRVNKMLQDAFDTAPRNGAAGVSQANVLMVSSLNVGNADIRKTKLGVDVFG